MGTDDLLQAVELFGGGLARAYAADGPRVAIAWRAYLDGDSRPLAAVIAELGTAPE